MAHLYFDESIRDSGEFIVGALVIFSGDISYTIHDYWREMGYDPNVFEYKSSAPKHNDPQSQQQRMDYLSLHRVQRRLLSKLATGLGLTILAASTKRPNMARLGITREILISLFAKSGNVCAFPGCNHELVTGKNVFVGQICHIEAASPGGQRYNNHSNDEERRSFANLLLLCYRHHKETDDIAVFDVQSLKGMKHEHEGRHGQKPFKINEAFLYRLGSEMEGYWAAITHDNRNSHVFPESAVAIPVGTPASEQFADVYSHLKELGEILEDLSMRDGTLNDEIRNHLELLGYNLEPYDTVPYYKNPFFNRNWETHALMVRNTRTALIVDLKQTEVRFLEEYAKTHSNDSAALQRLEVAKAELHEMALSCGFAD